MKILELGTSLGVSSSYLAAGNKRSEIITIEGDPSLSKIAQSNWNKLGLSNINLMNESFDTALAKIKDQKFDLIFIDGNHKLLPTLKYFKQLK